MIFLGAGASKVFGLKTLQELTTVIVKTMKRNGYGETINEILNALRMFNIVPDFENIYTTLEGLVNPREGIRNSGGFTAYIASKIDLAKIEEKSKYGDILADFKNLIYEECIIDKNVIGTKMDIFDNLFEVTRDAHEERFLFSKTGNSSVEIRKVNIGDTVVTTNYDLAMELYHSHREKLLIDGFRNIRANPYRAILDFSEYGANPTAKWLIKLHGSLLMYEQKGKIIKTRMMPQDCPIPIDVGKRIMIYPIAEKPILQEPFYSFYSIFKEQPWHTLIAIGHSFRDKPVNIAILERLRDRTSRKKLIVVNTHAEKVLKNLGPIDPKLNQQIIRINESFSFPDKNIKQRLFQKILMAVESKNWKEYQENVSTKKLSGAQSRQQGKAI